MVTVADPGFPRGGGANPKGRGAPAYYLANFSRKLHENEEIWGQRGGRVPRAPLRSATAVIVERVILPPEKEDFCELLFATSNAGGQR